MLDLSEISSIVKFIESLSFACSSLGYAMFIIYSFSSIYYITYKKMFNFWSIRNNLIMISQLNVRSGILSTYLSIYKLFPSLFWLKKLFLFISFPFLYYYLMLSHLWCIVYSLYHCLKYLFPYLHLVSQLSLQVYCRINFFLIHCCRGWRDREN